MNDRITGSHRKKKAAFIVARASAYTWAVALSRRLIPGAIFRTQGAALAYAHSLAKAAGLRSPKVTILADV